MIYVWQKEQIQQRKLHVLTRLQSVLLQSMHAKTREQEKGRDKPI
jgi:hypothetical protein